MYYYRSLLLENRMTYTVNETSCSFEIKFSCRDCCLPFFCVSVSCCFVLMKKYLRFFPWFFCVGFPIPTYIPFFLVGNVLSCFRLSSISLSFCSLSLIYFSVKLENRFVSLTSTKLTSVRRLGSGSINVKKNEVLTSSVAVIALKSLAKFHRF